MLLTIKDVSAWLNIKPSILYLWAAQGKIPCQKIHGLIRFDRQQIDAWLESFKGKQSGPTATALHANLTDLDQIIEAAKRDVYTPRHGETRLKSSLIGKEERDGAHEAE